MPDLPQLRAREIGRALERLGWVYVRAAGSHRIFVHPAHVRPVPVPWHAGDVARGTLRAIIRAAGVTVHELLAALKWAFPCPVVLSSAEFGVGLSPFGRRPRTGGLVRA